MDEISSDSGFWVTLMPRRTLATLIYRSGAYASTSPRLWRSQLFSVSDGEAVTQSVVDSATSAVYTWTVVHTAYVSAGDT